MIEFINAVGSYRFLQYALLTGVLAGFSCGIVGSFVVARRITYMAAAVAHFVLGGMGAARYFQTVCGIGWLDPFLGAVISAVIAAVIIGLVSIYIKQNEDTVIGAVWAVGMAVGILFISQTPGYNKDLMSYLFGNILMVGSGDLWMIAVLDVVIVSVVLLFYNRLQAVCFDEEFARLRGINVEFYYLLLLVLTALTVVLLITVVGIVMVIALLTLPAATASFFSRTLWQNILLAIVFSVLFSIAGLIISYGPNLPAGATIIITAALFYILAGAVSHLKRKYWAQLPRKSA